MNTGYILPLFQSYQKIHSYNTHTITFVCLITYVLWYMQILYRLHVADELAIGIAFQMTYNTTCNVKSF